MVNRARRPVLAAAALVGSLLLVGCSQPSRTGQAVLAVRKAAPTAITVEDGIPGYAVATLDPSQWGAQILIDQGTVMEGLYGYSPTGKIVPKIATHYKISDGGRVWTFYLRHNAKWSNGQPVTAEDFYYSWMRTASPKNSSDALWASVMADVSNANSYHAGGVPASDVGVKVVNPYEIRLTLTSPHNILGTMVIAGSMPLYPPSVNAHPSNWFMPQYFVGDGPYIVKSFVPNGEITLVRNPDYVGAAGEKNVGNIKTINVIPAPTVPVEDYVANKLSAAVISQPSDYKYALSHPSLRAQLHSKADNLIMYFQWDKSTMASPLDNVKVRQAIAMALDRAPIVDRVLNGMGGLTDVFGFAGWPTYKLQHAIPYNVPKAKRLLARAGYPGGKGIPTLYIYTQTTSTGSNVPVAEAIQQELKQFLGIKTKIIPEAGTLYGDITYSGLNSGIRPGYVIGGGTPNWQDFTSLPIASDQELLFAGAIGPLPYRQHAANYYYPKYDPTDVAQLGNPSDPNMGTTQAQWNTLQKAAEADIKYLTNWTNKQPEAYRKVLVVPGATTNQQQWDNYAAAWQKAKTPSQRHTAWVAAWDFVGDYSAGNGEANVGLNGQVWDDQHMPRSVYLANMWMAELNGTISQKTADRLSANLDNLMLQQGYGEPLYYQKTFFLEKPGLTGIEANPWSQGGLFQFQYATWK